MDRAKEPLRPAPRVSGDRLAPPQRSPFLFIFWGHKGLRAGWRLLIFFLTLAMLFRIEALTLHAIGWNHPQESKLTAQGLGWWLSHTKAVVFILVLLASWIMAKIERRRIADYGLPWQSISRLFLARSSDWFRDAHGFAGRDARSWGFQFWDDRLARTAAMEVRCHIRPSFSFRSTLRRVVFPRLSPIRVDDWDRVLACHGGYLRAFWLRTP